MIEILSFIVFVYVIFWIIEKLKFKKNQKEEEKSENLMDEESYLKYKNYKYSKKEK
jgi:large-conductance mechanosensitive channel